MSNPQAEKLSLENLARLQQMKINARLTALQSAQTLMATHGYTGIPGAKEGTGEPVWVKPPGAVDIVTLLAQAEMIEEYILGNIEEESQKAMDNAKAKLDPNRPKIVRP